MTSRYVPLLADRAVPMPDLGQGSCRSPEYRQVAWDAQTTDAPEQVRGVKVTVGVYRLAQRVCLERCPVRLACRDYILAVEQPAGAWGSVWGGLTPDERRKIHRDPH